MSTIIVNSASLSALNSSVAVPAPRAQSIQAPQRAARRGQHQAIVVVERRLGRLSDLRGHASVSGWHWVLGNCRVGDLFDQLLADADLTWCSLVVPREQQAAFALLAAPLAASEALGLYDEELRLSKANLTAGPCDGEPFYLIFNGHGFPVCDLRDAIAIHRQNHCDATLIDFPRAQRRGYDEKIQMDAEGRVRRVSRSYEVRDDSLQVQRDWPVITVLSGLAMKVLLDVALPERISQWPAALLRSGLVVRGSTIPGRVFSLHDREHLYELNEAVLRQRPQWLAAAGGLIDNGRHVWVGRNVRIDPTANLLGPIAIGDDVEIGPGAVIAGPATIGHGCRIGAGMIIKRSVLLPNATLAGGAFNGRALSHAIVPGGGPGVVQTIGQRGELQLQACSIDRHIHLESVLENPSTPALTPFVFGIFRFTKRFVDIVGSLVALILTVPFYPFVALAIKLNSPGPIFYGHTRQGMNGRNFACFKFRTMIVHAEEMKRKLITRNEVDGPQFKMRDDPRIFFVGRILRRLNIDEFPQFFNVLLGQMSLVGPRPSPERENQLCPAWREARLSVRPGITGLWQVMRGRDRGETDFQEWIYYDIQYVKKQSFWLDTKIVLKTFIVALGSGE